MEVELDVPELSVFQVVIKDCPFTDSKKKKFTIKKTSTNLIVERFISFVFEWVVIIKSVIGYGGHAHHQLCLQWIKKV